MERPLADKRPIGPFSANGGCNTSLGIIVNYGKRIPDMQRDEAANNLAGHLEASNVPVNEVWVGPDDRYDSVWVDISGRGFKMEDVQSAVSASVAEMEDSGIDVERDPDVEVILQ